MKEPVGRMKKMFIMTILVLTVFAMLNSAVAYEGDPSVAGVTVSGRVLYT